MLSKVYLEERRDSEPQRFFWISARKKEKIRENGDLSRFVPRPDTIIQHYGIVSWSFPISLLVCHVLYVENWFWLGMILPRNQLPIFAPKVYNLNENFAIFPFTKHLTIDVSVSSIGCKLLILFRNSFLLTSAFL